MNQIKFTITGKQPLLMHNARLCDPQNQFTQEIKKITSKGSKHITENDRLHCERLEWEGGMYYDEKLGPYIPVDNLLKCLIEGGMKARLGSKFKAATMIDDDKVKLEYKGPRDLDAMYKDGNYAMRCPATVNQSKVIRTRPYFPEWAATFIVDFDDQVLNTRQVKDAMTIAGQLVGIGDWRPRYGRFEVD